MAAACSDDHAGTFNPCTYRYHRRPGRYTNIMPIYFDCARGDSHPACCPYDIHLPLSPHCLPPLWGLGSMNTPSTYRHPDGAVEHGSFVSTFDRYALKVLCNPGIRIHASYVPFEPCDRGSRPGWVLASVIVHLAPAASSPGRSKSRVSF
jgi:hypothetical protein